MSNLRRRLVLGAAATAVASVAALGCFGGHLPARELYRLRLPDSADASPLGDGTSSAARAPGTLAILPYTAPGLYGARAIVYRIGESEYGAYANREWALPVATMLGMITEDVARRAPLTAQAAVFDPPSSHNYSYIWRGLVRELEEVDRGSQVFAAVRFDGRLVRARDDSVLWSGTVRIEREVPAGTMPAIVETLSQLSAEAVSQLLEQARSALSPSAASAARVRPQGTTPRR